MNQDISIAPVPRIHFPLVKTKAMNWVEYAIGNVDGPQRLADALGIDVRTVGYWRQRGNMAHVDVATVAAVARLSGVGIAELCGIDDLPELSTHRWGTIYGARGKKTRRQEKNGNNKLN